MGKNPLKKNPKNRIFGGALSAKNEDFEV